jgi:PAP2 superfamily
MRCILFALAWMCSLSGLMAQHRSFAHVTKVEKEATLLAAGTGLTLAGFVLQRRVDPLTQLQINQLDPSQVASFDRSATANWNPAAARFSDVMVGVSGAVAGMALLQNRRSQSRTAPPQQWLVMGTEALLLTTGSTLMSKALSLRTRPFAYNPNAPMDKKLERDARFSFFSGHTSLSACATFFAASLYTASIGEGTHRWKHGLAWTLAAGIPAVTGYLRVRSGKHFASDVAAGYWVGAAIGVGVPLIHRFSLRKHSNQGTLQLYPTPAGVGMALAF